MSGPSFNERFEIEETADSSRIKFVNRINDSIFEDFVRSRNYLDNTKSVHSLAFLSGERRPVNLSSTAFYLKSVSKGDFVKTLRLVELIHVLCYEEDGEELGRWVDRLIQMSETDIGIRWEGGKFYRKGAGELDTALANEPLKWLRARGAVNVLGPFEKGLSHFLDAGARPELYYDSITDFYESLEALAKLVTSRDKDLSGNAEAFVKAIPVTKIYKDHIRSSIKSYISYANNYRHAEGSAGSRPSVSEHEAESFMYSTGVFIRLGLQCLNNADSTPETS